MSPKVRRLPHKNPLSLRGRRAVVLALSSWVARRYVAATSLPLPAWGRGLLVDIAVRQRLLQLGDDGGGNLGADDAELPQFGQAREMYQPTLSHGTAAQQ